MGPDVSPLWQYIKMPAAQNTIVIYEDGSVVEKAKWDTSELRPENHVHTFILGGTDFRCEDTSFAYQSLLAAGYEFKTMPGADTHEDMYRDSFTYEWGAEEIAHQQMLAEREAERQAAQAEADRLARIATLEAELAALKGTP